MQTDINPFKQNNDQMRIIRKYDFVVPLTLTF